MGYKTFEDMKHNIPEGATHYINESRDLMFTWIKESDSGIEFFSGIVKGWLLIDKNVNLAKSRMVKIPSQIETPEEKEALDMIDTTSKQVESLAKGGAVEWNNGDHCVFGDSDMSGVYIAYDEYNSGHVIYSCGDYFYVLDGDFSKPESPEQKAERERLEAAFEVYLAFWSASKSTIITMSMSEFKECSDLDYWLAVVDKTGYRKQ